VNVTERDNVEKEEFMFDFGVYDISEAEAGDLFDKIIELVEELNAHIGGGYHAYSEETDDEYFEEADDG